MPAASISQFVHWFRAAAPYINAFRGCTFVIAFGGEVVADGKFVALTHDLNLLASLGVKLVVVHGARPQIEAQLAQRGLRTQYVGGVRVTDEAALACVKQATGQLRVEIEALLSMGLQNSPMANARINVASGNFVTAQPRGVVDGIDLLYSGQVRKIDGEAITAGLATGDIALLSPLGYSPTGEVFNLTLEDVAAAAAATLGAEKLIFLMNESGVQDAKGKVLSELTVSDAEALLKNGATLSDDTQLYLPYAAQACRNRVSRAHLISRHVDGGLLMELFTRDGIGTMITQDPLERLREAKIDDVGGVLQVIEPLEAEGVLVRRSRELLEREIERFSVLEHDGLIVGCAALYPFPRSDAAELVCLAVRPDYRNRGAGERLLDHVAARAKKKRLKRLFVLTTRTSHWFVERGFAETDAEQLPTDKLYNWQRRSKVFLKTI